METISIVIPVYNSARYLRECIDSVLGQSYGNLDVILVDDGSTDESPEICREYAGKDARVRFFRLEPVGVGAARNYGMEQARGKYLMFADSDDVCEPGLAGRLLAETEAAAGEENGSPVSLAVCGMRVTDEDGKETGSFREEGFAGRMPVREYMRNVLAKWQSHPLCGGVYCKLFETAAVKEHGIRFEEQETYAEDFLFNLAYLAHADEVTVLPDALYRYRMGRSGSLTEENRNVSAPEAVWARRKRVVAAYREAFAGAGLAAECAGDVQRFLLKNVTDVIEMAVRQGAKGEAFARWMAPLREEVREMDPDGVPGKERAALRLLRDGRFGLLRMYENARRQVRRIRGRER